MNLLRIDKFLTCHDQVNNIAVKLIDLIQYYFK